MPLFPFWRALALAALLGVAALGAPRAAAQSPADRLNGRSVFQRDSSGALAPAPSSEARPAVPGAGGSLLDRYRSAYQQRQIERLFGASGGAIRPVEPPPLPLASAEARAWEALLSFRDLPLVVDSLPPLFRLGRVQYVPPHERLSFRNRFGATRWAYAGTNYATALDTTQTWRLRAALQARYGPPTQTLSDLRAEVPLGPGSAFMFEYWFVVNDSIPLIVTDAGSPTDRGLVVGTDGERRVPGAVLRDLLLGDLPAAPRAAYADYRFDADARTWQVVGFDGVRLVRREIPRPDFRLVGRPGLEVLLGPRR